MPQPSMGQWGQSSLFHLVILPPPLQWFYDALWPQSPLLGLLCPYHKEGNEWRCGEDTSVLTCCSKEVTMWLLLTPHQQELVSWTPAVSWEMQFSCVPKRERELSENLASLSHDLGQVSLRILTKMAWSPFSLETPIYKHLWVIEDGCQSTFRSWRLIRSGRIINTQSKHLLVSYCFLVYNSFFSCNSSPQIHTSRTERLHTSLWDSGSSSIKWRQEYMTSNKLIEVPITKPDIQQVYTKY